MSTGQSQLRCHVCGKTFAAKSLMPGGVVRPPIYELIQAEHADWNEASHICLTCLNHFRAIYVQHTLTQERGELTDLEHQVIESLRQHELVAANINEQFDQRATFGEQLADSVASFGGSWKFMIFFGSALVIWIVFNSISLLMRPFDPFPFILLNLVLSCLAAIQAPVIMMSQNRQEAKDRLRSEHDYRINLKAELEIRHLHAKFDLLLTHQWQRLLEIQQLQTDLLEEIAAGRLGTSAPGPGSDLPPTS